MNASAWQLHRLSVRAGVFSTLLERLALDPNGPGKLRVVFERRINGTSAFQPVFDEPRGRDLEVVMEGIPENFRTCVALFLARTR
jgi:hypothetical protein